MQRILGKVWMAFLAMNCVLWAQPGANGALVLVNGTIIDGTGAEPILNGVLVLEGDKISAVGVVGEIEVPSEATIIDVEGQTILPGFIDSHVHNGFTVGLRRELLVSGITAICDLGSPISRMAEFEEGMLEDRLVSRGFRSGPIITAIGGLPDAVLKEGLNYEVGSIEEARAAVRDLAARGADVIKIYLHRKVGKAKYPMLEPDQIEAIVEEAHAQGILVRAHVSDLELLPLAIEAGVDVIEHLPKPPISTGRYFKNLLLTFNPDRAFKKMMFPPEYDVLFPVMAEKGVILVPTLMAGFGRFLYMEEASQNKQEVAKAVVEITRRFHDSGGTIALGTDFNPGTRGSTVMPLEEMELLVRAGMTRGEVIEAATRHAAYVSGHGDQLGTLEPGKLADVIVVGGNPLEDLNTLRETVMVIKGGEIAYTPEAGVGAIYTIQLSAWETYEEAEVEADVLRETYGLEPLIREAYIDRLNAVWYQVRVGRYATREETETRADEIEQMVGSEVLIDNLRND
ncbi:amidohydrolase family protein [Candidatus Neomarinimicrobiota bacterium]